MNLLRWLFGQRKSSDAVNSDESVVRVRYMRYPQTINLADRNLQTLAGASRATAKQLFAFLADQESMSYRDMSKKDATAELIGEIADEVHEFENARQGKNKIGRLLLRNNKVIELTIGDWK